jgi:hexokinase
MGFLSNHRFITNLMDQKLILGLLTGISLTSLVIFLQNSSKNIRVKSNKDKVLAKLEAEFRVPTEKLLQIVNRFIEQLDAGLSTPNQTLLALPTYITNTPRGNERGTFLALDLGGTNLRVCEIVLEGHGKVRVRQKKTSIPESLKISSATSLFNFIAKCTHDFLDEHKISAGRVGGEKLHLGFTFSFPVNQTSLNSGTIISWSKDFVVSDSIGKDAVILLREAFEREKLNIDVSALVNDTAGTLMAHAYSDPDTAVGVILGTGSNAAYIEKISNIKKWKKEERVERGGNDGKMVINIEWGAFDNEKKCLPVTKYDHIVDLKTNNPGEQIFEKMLSGLYLGEIARVILVELMEKKIIFQKNLTTLLIPHSFGTEYLSRIERDHTWYLNDIKAMFEDMFGSSRCWNGDGLEDRRIIKRICELVGTRASRISAAAIAAIIKKTNCIDGCTIAIDGSVYQHYPHFKNRMIDALDEMLGKQLAEKIKLTHASDGSSIGAALVAACHSK